MAKKEAKKRRRYFVVENEKQTGIHILHPSGGKDIVLGAYECQIISHDEWEDSPYLDEMVDEGHVKTYYADKRPAPIPNLPPEAPSDLHSQRAIREIALGNTVVEGELLAMQLINLNPQREGVYTEGMGNTDITYLKKKHHPVLKWAKWMLENFERAKFRDRIPVIKKRMEEIRLIP